jgi:hypothetical protein
VQSFSISQDHLHKLVGLAGIDNAIWQKLFASGANPNARDERGSFLLHKASHHLVHHPCSALSQEDSTL